MSLQIELDSPLEGSTYSAGAVLAGRVVVRESRYMIGTKEIEIILMGRERIKLESTYFPITVRIIKEARVLKTCTHARLLEPAAIESLPKETFIYPFHFDLPQTLPSSFKAGRGHVSYRLEAKMKPILRQDDNIVIPIRINGMLDLNREPDAQLPQECLKIKKPNLFVGRRGNIGLCLELVKSGFVPGELLDFHAYIRNKSNRDVLSMTASLLQATGYNSGFRTYGGTWEGVQEILNPVPGPAVEKGSMMLWKPTELVIPQVPPTGLGTECGLELIDVLYFLHFEMEISGLSRPIFAKLPVFIGTVPIVATTTVSNFPSAPMVEDEPSAPVLEIETESTEEDESGEIYMNPPAYEDVVGAGSSIWSFMSDHNKEIPPPSYSEAVIIERDNLEQGEVGNVCRN